MTTRTDVLRIRIETDNDGNARASLAGVADSADKVAQSTGGSAAATTANTEAMKASAQASAALTEVETARAETEAEAIARIHAMVEASLSADDVTRLRAEGELALGAAQERTTAITAEQVAAQRALAAAQTEAMNRYALQMAPMMQLNALLEKRTLTSAEVAAADQMLDDMQARGIISAGELAAAFQALDAAKIKDTAATQANTMANVENAASHINSRTAYSIDAALSDLATGQFSRTRREAAALANETGLLQKLMTPLGLAFVGAAASVGLLGLAFVKGVEQANELDRALLTTGNHAGVTRDELLAMAGSMDGALGAARQSIAAVTASGVFTGQQIRMVSQAVVDEMALTGKSVDQVVNEFRRLAEDPVKASEQLNQSEHYLTITILQQIDALQQRGDIAAAAELAEKARADALRTRATEMEANLGTLQRVWDSLKNSADFAWDAMLGVGRPSGPLDKLNSQYDQLGKTITALMDYQNGGGANVLSQKGGIFEWLSLPPDVTPQNVQQKIDALRKEQADLWNVMHPLQRQQDLSASSAASDQQTQDDAVIAQQTLDKLGISTDALTSKTGKLKDAASALFNIYIAGGKLPEGVNFNGPIGDQPMGPGWDRIKQHILGKQLVVPGVSALASFSQYVGNLTAQSQGNQMDDSAIGKYVTGVEKLDAAFNKAITAHADLTAATAKYDQGIQALGNDLAKAQAKETAADAAFKAQLDDQLALRKQAIDLQVQSIGMGAKEVQRMQELNQVQQQFDQQLAQLNRERDRGSISLQQYNDRLDALKTNEQATINAALAGYARADAAMGDWRNGALRAMKDMRDQFSDVAGQVDQTFTNAFSNMNQAIVQWVQTGKFSGKQFADNLISDLMQIELHVLESKILNSILGALMPSGAGIASSYMAGGGASYAASGVNWNVSLGGSANGNAFDPSGALTAFANGAAFTNSVVSQPTLFAFANGTGLMGERGPEAIMPLSRGADGKLGVVAQGGGGNVQVIVENHSDSKAEVQQSKDMNGGDIIKVIVGQAVSEVNKQIGRGGSTYKVMQQTFGLSRRGVPVTGG